MVLVWGQGLLMAACDDPGQAQNLYKFFFFFFWLGPQRALPSPDPQGPLRAQLFRFHAPLLPDQEILKQGCPALSQHLSGRRVGDRSAAYRTRLSHTRPNEASKGCVGTQSCARAWALALHTVYA